MLWLIAFVCMCLVLVKLQDTQSERKIQMTNPKSQCDLNPRPSDSKALYRSDGFGWDNKWARVWFYTPANKVFWIMRYPGV